MAILEMHCTDEMHHSHLEKELKLEGIRVESIMVEEEVEFQMTQVAMACNKESGTSIVLG